MRDKILTRAIIISVVLHLVAVGFIGRTSGTRLNASAITPAQQHLLDVALVKDPLSDPPKPKPVVVAPQRPDTTVPAPRSSQIVPPTAGSHYAPPAPGRPVRVANNAGGALNTGTRDPNGDISGLPTGRTPVGIVPGGDHGRGSGSGEAPGVNHSDPPRPIQPAYVQPAPRPPAPEPPPPPRPTPPPPAVVHRDPEPVHVNKIADRANPSLTHDVRPRVPDSIDEGLSLETEIEYYVDADGSVSGVRVAKSSGNRDWDRAVTSAASEWRYNPAVQDGTPRRVKVTRVVRCKT